MVVGEVEEEQEVCDCYGNVLIVRESSGQKINEQLRKFWVRQNINMVLESMPLVGEKLRFV